MAERVAQRGGGGRPELTDMYSAAELDQASDAFRKQALLAIDAIHATAKRRQRGIPTDRLGQVWKTAPRSLEDIVGARD